MNLDYLKTYIMVVELRSFSEVARRRSVTQPAVSFQIQRLERDLGVRLIDRKDKIISMTQAGKCLFSFAKVIEKEMVHFLYNLDQLRDKVVGDLSIVASTMPSEFIVPQLLGEFKSLYPHILPSVVVFDSYTTIEKVQSGEYEVGFCGIAPEGSELELFKVAEDEIVLAVFSGHPFAQREKVSLMEVEKEPLIFRNKTSGTQGSLEGLLLDKGYNMRRCSPTLILGSTQAVVSAIEAGIGISFVSNLAIRKSLALGLVKIIPIDELKLKRNFYCIYRKERLISRLLQEFIAFIQAKESTSII
ncbi:MAG: LysR family transcriptional regulator [Thermodesulfobacteriota bacterium]|nr:LysR family transcriptional regulator [Thermodesulfobacteriota bacterium]